MQETRKMIWISRVVILVAAFQFGGENTYAVDCDEVKNDYRKVTTSYSRQYDTALKKWNSMKASAFVRAENYKNTDCQNQKGNVKLNPAVCESYKFNAIQLAEYFKKNPDFMKPNYQRVIKPQRLLASRIVANNQQCFSALTVAKAQEFLSNS